MTSSVDEIRYENSNFPKKIEELKKNNENLQAQLEKIKKQKDFQDRENQILNDKKALFLEFVYQNMFIHRFHHITSHPTRHIPGGIGIHGHNAFP